MRQDMLADYKNLDHKGIIILIKYYKVGPIWNEIGI